MPQKSSKEMRATIRRFADMNRIYELQARLGEERLRYTGEGDRIGLTYRYENDVVVWSGGVSVVVSIDGIEIRQRHLLSTHDNTGPTRSQVRARMCREGDVYCQEILDTIRAEIEREIEEAAADPHPHLQLVVSN